MVELYGKKRQSWNYCRMWSQQNIRLLTKNLGKESRAQRKFTQASDTSLGYGVPDIGLNWREVDKGYQKKVSHCWRHGTNYSKEDKAVIEVVPASLSHVATRYWYEVNTSEPAKHRNHTIIIIDNGKVITTKYQTADN